MYIKCLYRRYNCQFGSFKKLKKSIKPWKVPNNYYLISEKNHIRLILNVALFILTLQHLEQMRNKMTWIAGLKMMRLSFLYHFLSIIWPCQGNFRSGIFQNFVLRVVSSCFPFLGFPTFPVLFRWCASPFAIFFLKRAKRTLSIVI